MRSHVAWLLSGCVLVGPSAGCGGGDPEDFEEAACAPDVRTVATRPAPEAELRGSVRVRDERDTSALEGTRLDLARGRVTASFGRVPMSGNATVAAGLDLGGGCVGLTSRPVLGDTTVVPVDRLSVADTAIGQVDVPSLGEGRFAYIGAPLLPAVGTALRVQAQEGAFPGFSATIAGVEDLQVLEPDPRTTGLLGLNPIRLRWEAGGDADAVQIEVAPATRGGASASGGQVVCRVVDDGCYALPESAVVFLRSSRADRFVVTMRRERVQVVALAEAEVLLEASSLWRFDLEADQP